MVPGTKETVVACNKRNSLLEHGTLGQKEDWEWDGSKVLFTIPFAVAAW